jgi:hypothetical protein
MNEEEELLLKALVEGGKGVFWCPEGVTSRKVTSVRERLSEPGLCAHFQNGEYVALYNCELSDFILGKRISFSDLLPSKR